MINMINETEFWMTVNKAREELSKVPNFVDDDFIDKVVDAEAYCCVGLDWKYDKAEERYTTVYRRFNLIMIDNRDNDDNCILIQVCDKDGNMVFDVWHRSKVLVAEREVKMLIDRMHRTVNARRK